MMIEKRFLSERLGVLKSYTPPGGEIGLKVFGTFDEANRYFKREFSEELSRNPAFSMAWTEPAPEGAAARAFGVIGMIREEWPPFFDMLEDVDSILAEEYFHILNNIEKKAGYDSDRSDYMAITRAIGTGMTSEMASSNLKSLEDNINALRKLAKHVHTSPTDYVNSFARATALITGPHRRAFEKGAYEIRKKTFITMNRFVENVPGRDSEAIKRCKDALLSKKAYSSEESIEAVKRALSKRAAASS